MRYAIQIVLLLASIMSQPVAAADQFVDGVPLPGDAKVAVLAENEPMMHRRFAGVWVGVWDGILKHILMVESVATDGRARVIYAIGDSPLYRVAPAWSRHAATISGSTLIIGDRSFSASYDLRDDGTLNARYERGVARSQATLVK